MDDLRNITWENILYDKSQLVVADVQPEPKNLTAARVNF